LTPIFVTIAVLIASGIVFFLLRRSTAPPAAMFAEIRTAILDLQRVASQNIFLVGQTHKLNGIDQDHMLRQSCHVRETIRYVYTIEESESGFVHVISSQLLKPKPEKYQIQCMLIAMLTLNQCLADSSIDPKSVEFNIDRSATGTHYVAMSLTRQQHDQMLASRNRAGPQN
jgi:hypothetical protein